ncbi:hypothetical protein B0O80DRAFT_437431 [Mortierella sp. GBAus27b]|nr:hypothetical protein B0O80DRAFT_437431 [Mortierella sp. GBAus27b]
MDHFISAPLTLNLLPPLTFTSGCVLALPDCLCSSALRPQVCLSPITPPIVLLGSLFVLQSCGHSALAWVISGHARYHITRIRKHKEGSIKGTATLPKPEPQRELLLV